MHGVDAPDGGHAEGVAGLGGRVVRVGQRQPVGLRGVLVRAGPRAAAVEHGADVVLLDLGRGDGGDLRLRHLADLLLQRELGDHRLDLRLELLGALDPAVHARPVGVPRQPLLDPCAAIAAVVRLPRMLLPLPMRAAHRRYGDERHQPCEQQQSRASHPTHLVSSSSDGLCDFAVCHPTNAECNAEFIRLRLNRERPLACLRRPRRDRPRLPRGPRTGDRAGALDGVGGHLRAAGRAAGRRGRRASRPRHDGPPARAGRARPRGRRGPGAGLRQAPPARRRRRPRPRGAGRAPRAARRGPPRRGGDRARRPAGRRGARRGRRAQRGDRRRRHGAARAGAPPLRRARRLDDPARLGRRPRRGGDDRGARPSRRGGERREPRRAERVDVGRRAAARTTWPTSSWRPASAPG